MPQAWPRRTRLLMGATSNVWLIVPCVYSPADATIPRISATRADTAAIETASRWLLGWKSDSSESCPTCSAITSTSKATTSSPSQSSSLVVTSFSSSARSSLITPRPRSARGRPLRGSAPSSAARAARSLGGRQPPQRSAAPATRRPSAPVVVASRPPRVRAARNRSASGLRTRTVPQAERVVWASSGSCVTRRPWLMITTSSTICATSASTWLEIRTVPPAGRKGAGGSRATSGCPPGRARSPVRRARAVADRQQRAGNAEPLAHSE